MTSYTNNSDMTPRIHLHDLKYMSKTEKHWVKYLIISIEGYYNVPTHGY